MEASIVESTIGLSEPDPISQETRKTKGEEQPGDVQPKETNRPVEGIEVGDQSIDPLRDQS